MEKLVDRILDYALIRAIKIYYYHHYFNHLEEGLFEMILFIDFFSNLDFVHYKKILSC